MQHGTATPGVDFETPLSDEVVIQPGEKSGGISLMMYNDILPEQNETFSVTVYTSDNVTVFSETTVNVSIIDNGKGFSNQCVPQDVDVLPECVLNAEHSCCCEH